jgi:hypothetical protein
MRRHANRVTHVMQAVEKRNQFDESKVEWQAGGSS